MLPNIKMMSDPYNDSFYKDTVITPKNPPHRQDVYRQTLTIQDRQNMLARHHDLVAESKRRKPEHRKDKKVACTQKPSFIEKGSSLDGVEEWIKHTTLQLEKTAPLKSEKYCLKMINDRLLAAKTKLFSLKPEDLQSARLMGNPYEGVGCSIFMNRAAVKMASLDAMYQLTAGKKSLVYADVAGGPGGFTEYLNWRCQQNKIACKGFGITLKGNQDWNLYDFKAVKSSSLDFTTHYGVDGSGDLYNIENAKSFAAMVQKATKDAGVDLVVADGGFSVKGDEDHQEHHSKLILVAQVLAMLRILKTGGNFVLKVFDILTDFSVDLLYLLYLHFEKISICKPFSSRPANSERYIVCLHLQGKERHGKLISFLEDARKQLLSLRPSDLAAKSAHVKHQPGFVSVQEKIDLGLLDLPRLLDQTFIAKDESFVDAIEGSNMKLATKQKDALEDLHQYATNPSLLPYDQDDIASQCCKEWKIPYQSNQ